MMEKRSITEGVETIKKPVLIDDYNLHMGGVVESDQLVLYTMDTLTDLKSGGKEYSFICLTEAL